MRGGLQLASVGEGVLVQLRRQEGRQGWRKGRSTPWVGRVTCVAGKVVLTGDVHSWSERQEAARVAWSAPGVSAVDNRIHIAV